MVEKRNFLRLRVSLPFGIDEEGLSFQSKGVVKDISMQGLKIVMDKPSEFSIDESGYFHLQLPDRTLKVSGKVIWEKEYKDKKEIGIRFVHIADGHKEDIYNYIFKYHQRELTQKWWQM